MLDFSSLQVEVKVESKPEPKVIKQGRGLNFNQLEGVSVAQKKSHIELKLERETLHKIEPGYKNPVANSPMLAQWCDYCQDVQAFVNNVEREVCRCLNCKKDKYYGTQRHRNPKRND